MINELTELYGKYAYMFRGDHYFYVWRLEFDGHVFKIYTAKNYGTSISIEESYNKVDSPALKKVCINFLTKLESELLKVKK